MIIYLSKKSHSSNTYVFTLYVYNMCVSMYVRMYTFICTVHVCMYIPSQDSWTSVPSPFLSPLQPWIWLPMATYVYTLCTRTVCNILLSACGVLYTHTHA